MSRARTSTARWSVSRTIWPECFLRKMSKFGAIHCCGTPSQYIPSHSTSTVFYQPEDIVHCTNKLIKTMSNRLKFKIYSKIIVQFSSICRSTLERKWTQFVKLMQFGNLSGWNNWNNMRELRAMMQINCHLHWNKIELTKNNSIFFSVCQRGRNKYFTPVVTWKSWRISASAWQPIQNFWHAWKLAFLFAKCWSILQWRHNQN